MLLMEQPLPIIFVGLIVVISLVGGLLKTGRLALLYAAILTALATTGLVVLERLVITPGEEVKATLHVVADLLERNDADAVIQYVSKGRPKLREEVRLKMGMVSQGRRRASRSPFG